MSHAPFTKSIKKYNRSQDAFFIYLIKNETPSAMFWKIDCFLYFFAGKIRSDLSGESTKEIFFCERSKHPQRISEVFNRNY